MAHPKPASADIEASPTGEKSPGDPWHAFGYLVAGVMVYGFVGWLLDRWWGTSFVVAIGIVFGAGLGIYMTFMRFNRNVSTNPSTNPSKNPGTNGD